jgi:ABC-2 type transport system ATP-binding protein
MKVKYSLALALSHHAELLMLDEPTSGLDPVSRDELLDIFLTLAREGTSILFSTHITSDLEKCADRLTYIRQGRIVASEPLDAFVSRYRAYTLTDAQLTPALREKLIGLKPAKHGYTAIALAEDARALGVIGEPAGLDTIMVHLEKE